MMPAHKLNHSFIKGYPPADNEIQLHDTLVKGLTVRIYKSGYKSFNFRYELGGRTCMKSIGKVGSVPLKDARDIAREWKLEVIRGNNPQDKSDSLTFRELAEKFKTNKFPHYSKNTKKAYDSRLKNELSKLNNISISNIERRDVTAIIDKKAIKYKGSANEIKKVFSVVMNWAVQRGYIDKNVIAGLKNYDTGGARTRFYSEDEIRLLWSQFNEMNEPIGKAYKMLLLTGQRKNEILKLEWIDVNFDDKYFMVPAHRAKNNNENRVPLSSKAFEILECLKQQYPKSEFCFPSPWTNKDQPLEGIREAKEVIQDSFISDFSPHDLRRTVATHCAKIGVPQHIVGRLLNHKGASGQNSITAIYNRYNYIGEVRTALKQWDKHLLAMVEDN